MSDKVEDRTEEKSSSNKCANPQSKSSSEIEIENGIGNAATTSKQTEVNAETYPAHSDTPRNIGEMVEKKELGEFEGFDEPEKEYLVPIHASQTNSINTEYAAEVKEPPGFVHTEFERKNALDVKQREFGVINIKPTASNDDMNEFPNVASKISVLHEVNEPPNMALKECKVKEILNGILDCKVLRTSSTQDLSAVNKSSKANASEEIPENCPDTSSQCSHVQTSKLVTVKEILGEILDYSIFKKSLPAHEERRPACKFAEATSSRGASNCEICRSEANVESRRYQIFRTSGPLGIINSSNAMHSESFISSQVSKKSLNRMLPSYSAVLRLGPKRSVKSIESFIPRLPPPSYAEVEGLWEDSPTLISSDSVVFGPDPVYMVCPACRTVVVTDVERERSNVTHLVALVLCVFLCWPCCLLPYCLKSCNYSYHSCPNCRHYFGVYNPF